MCPFTCPWPLSGASWCCSGPFPSCCSIAERASGPSMAGPVAGDVAGSPLGREQDYAGGYDPSRLYPIARADSRSTLAAAPARGFHGVDWWTAFELSWLDGEGRPQIAVGRFAVPADSPCIVESKSLKLYLGGLYNVAYERWAALEAVLAADLSAAARAPVGVTLESVDAFEARGFDRFLGTCVDSAPLRQDAGLLAAEGQATAPVRQRFHSHTATCSGASAP
ncbi:MAG: hypothetical protein EBU29_07755 [Gammaproteobacteria bacterium]|nr:hypothetical protein [Gammaproteobacteria bacterium]